MLNEVIPSLVLLFATLGVQGSHSHLKELHIGGMFPMSGGWAGGQGCLPAVSLALDDVNNNSHVLPGYKLNVTVKNTQCLPGLGLKKMYELLYNPVTNIMMLTGCSGVSTFVAEAAPKWNLVVLAYGSSSPALSNRMRFPTFFRTHPSATLHNPTRIKLFNHWGWNKIATIQQTEELFTSTINDLEKKVKEAGVEITVRASFLTDPTSAVRHLKRQDARIIVGVFYEDKARKVICEAYKEKLYGNKYVWFLIGWYPDNWYKQQDVNCTISEMEEALEGHFTTEGMVLYRENHTVTDTGITAEEFIERLDKALNYTDPSQVVGYPEAPLAYDAVWALAFALNNSLASLRRLNLSFEDFTYSSEVGEVITSTIYGAMNSTNFLGVSGPVSFTAEGDRIAWTQIEQMNDGKYRKIAFYDYASDDLKWAVDSQTIWKDGQVPQDEIRVVVELRLVTIVNYVVMCMASTVGILAGLTGIIYTSVHRHRRVVHSSKPNLNTLSVCGFIVCLLCVFLFGLDGRYLDNEQFGSMCKVKSWILSIGFTLGYGSMLSKTLAVYRRNPKQQKGKTRTSDHEVMGLVAIMLLVDIIILSTWKAIDPLQLEVESFVLEHSDTESDVMILPHRQYCMAKHNTIWIGVLLSYKGLLLLCGVLLAYETRGVKLGSVSDSKFIGMAIYNVAVMCSISGPVLVIIDSQQNASYIFLSLAIIISSYVSIGLIYVPKIIAIRKSRDDLLEMRKLTEHIRPEQIQENEALKNELEQKEEILLNLRRQLEIKNDLIEKQQFKTEQKPHDKNSNTVASDSADRYRDHSNQFVETFIKIEKVNNVYDTGSSVGKGNSSKLTKDYLFPSRTRNRQDTKKLHLSLVNHVQCDFASSSMCFDDNDVSEISIMSDSAFESIDSSPTE